MENLTGASERVARALLRAGSATVAEVAEQLGLTGAAVRKHLDELVGAGLVASTQHPPFGPDRRPRRRGRPARYYHLTQSGRDRFDQDYDHLAVSALRFMADTAGPGAVMAFARRRVAEFEDRYAGLMDSQDPISERVDLLADALAAEGYAAVATPSANGIQICQHNCPVAHVAAEFPRLCEAETEAFGRMLGTHVMRLATLAHGDGICTTHIPTAVHGRTSS